MMNVEADVTIGPYLRREADKAGLVYTIGAGDETTATMELIEFCTALGFPSSRQARARTTLQPLCRAG